MVAIFCVNPGHIRSLSNSNLKPYEMAHQMLIMIINFGRIIAELTVKIFSVIGASFAVAKESLNKFWAYMILDSELPVEYPSQMS